jgi:ribonuclease HII
MGYIIGTDEAGYGPNLGPLLVSATVWEAPDGIGGEQLFRQLEGVVANALPKKRSDPHNLPVFADSKILYSPGKGMHHLERGLRAAWALLGCNIATWREIWEKLAPGSIEAIDACPFYRNFDKSLDGIAEIRTEWREKFAQSGVKLLTLRSRAVFPAEFNRLMDEHESKGAALSHLTLGLIADLMRPLEKGPISVLCDKHGGRDRYAALLNEHFPDNFIEVYEEGRQSSRYRFGPPQRKVEFQFRAKAESCLPAALASMASKYLRELAMEAFNAFWSAHVSNLAPTAGYPQDAKRFRLDIAEKQRELKIHDDVLWRKK